MEVSGSRIRAREGKKNWKKKVPTYNRHLGTLVVGAHVADPLSGIPVVHDAVAVPMYRQSTFPAREMLVAPRLHLITDGAG